MKKAGPNVSPGIAVAVISLAAGGALGFYAREFVFPQKAVAQSSSGGGGGGPRPMAMPGSGGDSPGAGGGGGRMGGGGFGGGNAGGMAVARLVRNLQTIEAAQGKGLTPTQSKTILPILKQMKTADKITADDATKLQASIEGTLTPEQKSLLEAMTPRRGGGGAGGPGGGSAPGGGGPGGPMAMGGPGGGGGGRPNPEKPFATGTNQKALDDLLASLGKS